MESATRLDLLIRTSKRKKEARSPQQQRDIAEACAQQHGYEVVMVHDSGRSESGKTMDRESVHAAMQRVRAGLTDGVIVALLDRVGRAPIEEAMGFVRELDAIGGCLVPADGGGRPVDLTDPQAESMLVIQLQIGRQYWLTKANGMKRSVRDAIKAGRFIGPTPLGYERVAGRLSPSDAHATVITEAYRRAAQDGLHAAVDYLRAEVPERRWNTDHVRRLLRSRTYLGEVHYKGYEPNLHAHEPLTDLATWTAAQTGPQPRRANDSYPLTGLVACAECRAPMVGALQTVHGRKYRRYRCSDAKACNGGSSISADRLEEYLHDWLRGELVREGGTLDRCWPGADATSAELALKAAVAARDAYADDVEQHMAAGREAHLVTLAAHRDRVERAQTAYRTAARTAARADSMPGADQLDEPEGLRRGFVAVGALGIRFTIARGRGAVAVRVQPNVDDRAVVA